MNKIEGIIFDIDGTLTSTNQLIFESIRFVTNKYLGENFTNEEIIGLFGPPENVIFRKLFNDKFDEAKKDFLEFYKNNHKQMADAYPGIKNIVAKINNAFIPLSIFTGKGRETSEITLQEIDLLDKFDFIVSGDDVTKHKPSGEGIELFTKKYNLVPENVLMIGDSTVDIIASKEAGVKIASVLWDSYGKDKVLEMDRDFTFHTVNELDIFISNIIKNQN